MAIFHLSGQVLKRRPIFGKDGSVIRPGSNAVAAAAYRSGERLKDEQTGKEHDYTRRSGVSHTEIIAPDRAPAWMTDRSLLWNAVEAMEKRNDAQLAREFNMALPFELSAAQRLELVRDYVKEQFVSRGMVADIAWHDPMPEHGQNARNYHAHVMLTLRRATAKGLDPVKTREWNSRELMGEWRAAWATACNSALERAGRKERIDHRTLAAQRQEAAQRGDWKAAKVLDREPEVHVGVRARQMVRNDRPPVSRVRDVGAYRAGAQSAAQRRQRDYPRHDRGTRLNWLESILVGNNEALRADLSRLSRRHARFMRKIDYWDRRFTFWSEGTIGGKAFRFERWKAAQAEKQRQEEAARKAEHAKRRVAQIKAIVTMLERIMSGGTRSREKQLVRAREVRQWRGVRKSLERDRDGRSRA